MDRILPLWGENIKIDSILEERIKQETLMLFFFVNKKQTKKEIKKV